MKKFSKGLCFSPAKSILLDPVRDPKKVKDNFFPSLQSKTYIIHSIYLMYLNKLENNGP